MNDVAAIVRRLVAAGVDPAEAASAVAEAYTCGMEAGVLRAPARTARQERNARYYAKVASEKRLNASEQDVSDVQDASPSSPKQRKVSPCTPSKETQPSSPPPSASPQAYTGRARAMTCGFAEFWEAYPRKIGKDAAEKAFAKAIQRAPELTVSDLRQALDAYRRFKPPDQDYCHPATWLNQGRWNDDWTGSFDTSRGQGRGAPPRPTGASTGIAGLAAALAERPDSRFSAQASGQGGFDRRAPPEGPGDVLPFGPAFGAGFRG